jgi:hypothetical protein
MHFSYEIVVGVKMFPDDLVDLTSAIGWIAFQKWLSPEASAALVGKDQFTNKIHEAENELLNAASNGNLTIYDVNKTQPLVDVPFNDLTQPCMVVDLPANGLVVAHTSNEYVRSIVPCVSRKALLNLWPEPQPYHDERSLQQNPVKQKKGRPEGAGSYREDDARCHAEMGRLMNEDSSISKFAASMRVAPTAKGFGTIESKAKRLMRGFPKNSAK